MQYMRLTPYLLSLAGGHPGCDICVFLGQPPRRRRGAARRGVGDADLLCGVVCDGAWNLTKPNLIVVQLPEFVLPFVIHRWRGSPRWACCERSLRSFRLSLRIWTSRLASRWRSSWCHSYRQSPRRSCVPASLSGAGRSAMYGVSDAAHAARCCRSITFPSRPPWFLVRGCQPPQHPNRPLMRLVATCSDQEHRRYGARRAAGTADVWPTFRIQFYRLIFHYFHLLLFVFHY
jgi:hypothetical protein